MRNNLHDLLGLYCMQSKLTYGVYVEKAVSLQSKGPLHQRRSTLNPGQI